MKTNITILMASVLLLASCGTYQGQGAAGGAYFGSILGSAIGGISNGHRGSDVGTLIGMAGGAVVGAAIGKAADDQRSSDLQQYQAEKQRLASNRQTRAASTSDSYQQDYSYSGYDSTNSGDDRIDIDFGTESSTSNEGVPVSSLVSASGKASLEIRNARFIDEDGDNVISRGEQCEIAFEIYNSGTATAYNIEPYVAETSGNSHIMVSPNILVESLAAGKGVKYTARVVGDNSLKTGTAQFAIGVLLNGTAATQSIDFTVNTSKQ